MSWLLFLDESGHDHKSMPYEVRGGVAIHASNLWRFIKDLQRRELDAFGAQLHQYRTEIKGSKLLDKDRFTWAAQESPLAAEDRREHCRTFLSKGLQKKPPSRVEFTAYGQGCLEMATGIFESLRDHQAKLFAAAIPKGVHRPDPMEAEDFLRKDHVFLLERYFYHLEDEDQHGLVVMDQVEASSDRRFVRRLEEYFQKTQTGRHRAARIVPAPFFVASDMCYPVQAADVAIYCVNWGFRLPLRGMTAETRSEIAENFGPWLAQLQFLGRQQGREGDSFNTYGIVYVPDPYTRRSSLRNEKGGNAFSAVDTAPRPSLRLDY